MSRYYSETTINQFQDLIQAHIDAHDGDLLEGIGKKALKDISKVDFDFENFEYQPFGGWSRMNAYLGYKTIDDGFNYLSCYAGGDWEHPVCFILYWDGKQIRGYVPTEGNCWNYKTKKAFGNDELQDQLFITTRYNVTDNTWHEHVDQMYDLDKMQWEIRNHITRSPNDIDNG